jgi:hypothetical protein
MLSRRQQDVATDQICKFICNWPRACNALLMWNKIGGQAHTADDAGRMAEKERALLIERTKAGMERARAKRKTFGRPRKTMEIARMAMMAAHHGGATISALARLYGVSRATVLRIIRAAQPTARAPATTTPAKAVKGTGKRLTAACFAL